MSWQVLPSLKKRKAFQERAPIRERDGGISYG